MCWNVALLQQGVQFVRNDKIIEYVEVLTTILAIPWVIKIPGCNDISLVIKFPRNFITGILFLSNQIYCKYTLKRVQVAQTKLLFPQMGRLLNIRMNYFCLLYCTDYRRVERVSNGVSLITPLYQWMQLSVACLVPYSSVLFHSYSLLNIAVAHQTFDRPTCSPNSIAVAHRILIELQLTVHQPCSSNSNQSKMELMSIKLYVLLQCWQDIIPVKCAKLLYMCDLFITDCVPCRIFYLKVP